MPQLDDPGFLAAFGVFVRDHDHLKSLLFACEPEQRRQMYEAITPHLRFKARTFDQYLQEVREDAEARQLPTLAADGTLQGYRVPELTSLDRALNEAVARVSLTLVCRNCTREEVFAATDRYEAVKAAREAGWVYDETTESERCPECSGPILT
jgi:hypothetical protein